MEDPLEENDLKKNPRRNANPLSALTFCWLLSFFWRGYRVEYHTSDLFQVLEDHESQRIGDQLEEAWEKEIKTAKKPSLCWVLAKVFGCGIGFYGIFFGILELIFKMAQPIAIGYLVMYYSPDLKDQSTTELYIYSAIIVGCSIVSVLIYFPTLMALCHSALKMKVGLASLVYRKSLRLSSLALEQIGGAGHTVNLVSNDVNRIDLMVLFIHNIWIGPLVTIFASYIMYQVIQESVFVGVFLVLFFIPFQAWLTKISAKMHSLAAKKTDARLGLMSEIIKGMQVIKMHAWEKPFSKIILALRKQEIILIKYSSYIKGVHIAFTVFRSRTAIFGSILAYVLLGNILTAEKVFVVTACFNTMKRTMTDLFSYAVEQLILARVSIRRIEKFLLLEESYASINENAKLAIQNTKFTNTKNVLLKNILPGPKRIKLTNVCANWCDEKSDFMLKNINLDITSPSFIAIVGPIGCGKTNLLEVILWEKNNCSGNREISGKLSYSPQEPWLFNQTIRNNIIMGEDFIESRYSEVLEICALLEDMKRLRFGDKTWAGERGCVLSGGQRVRVNLARALYRQADIYILDDPLSALDAHVANHIFANIKKFLSHKICILVTHQHQYLPEIENIIILQHGQIAKQGSYEELKEDIHCVIARNKHTVDEKEEISNVVDTDVIKRTISVPKESGRTGRVSWDVYREYMKAYGNPVAVLIIFMLFVCGQISASSSDFFIGYWVNLEQAQHANNMSESEEGDTWQFVQQSCIFVYSGINLLTVLLTVASSFLFFNISMGASETLHNNMFGTVIEAGMLFFNLNHSGHILNRFSKDLENVDEQIPSAIINCVQTSLSILGILGIVAIVQPWLIIPTGVAFGILLILRNIYTTVSTNLKRLEASTRSPLLYHVTATLQGLHTIRAFKVQSKLQEEFDRIQDTHSTARYLVQATARMFAMWLETACVFLLILVVLGFLMSDTEQYGGNVGLAITQVMSMMGLIQWAVRQSSDLEAYMTSVERVVDYCKLDTEKSALKGPSIQPGQSWPQRGQINFNNVCFSYYPSGEVVLKNLNFLIQPKEKIGIVGRTGAGKTSIINALLQLYNTSGTIIIDDINLSQLDLGLLRSKISVIPQEPMLFSGTVRQNLDPLGQCEDIELWNSLEQVELKKTIEDMNGRLDGKIMEGGSNFSVGQRQLLCLARAIIRGNKILVLDEATANLDPETDQLLQKTIRQSFTDCTVLTIAHRVHNVMDSDRLMVIVDSELQEFDHPRTLLSREDSYLSKLIAETDQASADKLRDIAEQHYLKHQGDV